MSNEFNEKIFRSVDTIVSARLQQLPYDKTIVGTIKHIPVSKNEVQKYIIDYKGAELVAYVNTLNKVYDIGDEVYVLIPQGDFTQKKIITGQVISEYKVDNKDTSQQFIPVESICDIFDDTLERYRILLTGNKIATEISLYSNTFSESNYLIGYTKLKVKISLSANLVKESKQVIAGDYGIKIILGYIDQTSSENIERIETQTITLKSSNMALLDPYNTGGFTSQEIDIDVSSKKVTNLNIFLYQNGNFSTAIGDVEDTDVFYLQVRDVITRIGYINADFPDNKNYGVYLYGLSALNYGSTDIQKKWRFRIIDRASKTLADTLITNGNISYYLYKYNGVSTMPVSTVFPRVYYDSTPILTESNVLLTKLNLKDITLTSGNSLASQRYSILIRFNNITFYSNELSFTNLGYIENTKTLDLLSGVQLTPNNNNNIFNIYGPDNSLLDESDGQKTQRLSISFSSTDGSRKTLMPNDIIEYWIPKDSTMLLPASLENINTDPYGRSIYYFKKTLQKEDLTSDGTFLLPFKISSFYNPLYKNNTIECQLTINKTIYKASQEFLFGTSGSSGSDYILTIGLYDMSNNKINALDASNYDSSYNLQPALYNYSMTRLNLDANTVKYKWYNYPSLIDPKFKMPIIESNTINFSGLSKTDILNNAKYFIIEATCIYKGVELKGYLIIPTTTNVENYAYISGCSTITYDITGKKPVYSNNEYKLYDSKDAEVDNIKWSLEAINNDMNLLKFNTVDRIITPSSIYSSANIEPCIIAKTQSNAICWIQPLLILQNKYPSAMQNGEGNKASLPQENGDSIDLASTMVGKLERNDRNQISGLVMGTFESSNNENFYGLYAYDQNKIILEVNNKGIAKIKNADTAISANKLQNTDGVSYNVGDTTTFVYFKNGIPIAGGNINDLITQIKSLNNTIAALTKRVEALEAAKQ